MTRSRAKLIAIGLWSAAIAITALFAWRRCGVGDVSGTDFNIWMRAAQAIADGRSPYVVRLFVYPPPVALLLVPFAHADHVHVWRIWTALEVAALIAGALLFVLDDAPRAKAWQRPALFLFCSVTVLNFWPVTLGLRLGQTDAFVFAVLLGSGFMATRGRAGARGVLLGVGGLLKVWPAASALVLFQRGLERRRAAVRSFVLTILVAPVLILVVAGWSGIGDFFGNNFDARTQPLVSDSVWGAPKLLFSHSVGRPLLDSPALRYGVTAILLVWVLGLIVVALQTPGDPSLCLWNVTLCVVLLLPIAHTTYSLFGVPILWLWVSRVVARAPERSAREITVAVVLFAWWAAHTRAWPGHTLTEVSSARYCVDFTVNLVACTVSVAGARWSPSPVRVSPG